MTEAEIVKALEYCMKNDLVCSDNCPGQKLDGDWKYECRSNLMQNAIDLINRQKAENEKNENIIRLADKTIETANAEIERLKTQNSELKIGLKVIKKTVIKRFAERLRALFINDMRFYRKTNEVVEKDLKRIDNLVKEMTEQSVNYGSSKMTE